MSIIDLKKNNKLKEEITNLIDIKKNLIISFDNDSNKIIDLFFMDIPNIIDYYFISNNYFYQIDLLEYSLPNNLNIYLWFVNCIEIANNIIHSKSNKYIELFGPNINIWKISLCQNIMFNYPFTLADIIFFPLKYIIEQFNLKNQNKIINTLIHEKIHIGQRFNELIWEKFIELNNYNWKKINSQQIEFSLININLSSNNNLLEKEYIFILNPDTTYNNFKYIWISNDNKIYYGHYIYNKKTKKIKKKYFQLDVEKKQIIPTDIELQEEHPYETYAYKISEELTINIK